MKHILLPTDFSENATNAIRYAVQLFKNEACTFYLLHTYTPAAYNVFSLGKNYSSEQLQEITQRNAEEALQKVATDVENEFQDSKHTFKCIASFNVLVNETLNLIKTKEIDSIVMGTKGATGAKEIFIGTHTTQVLKKVDIPVIAVPSGYTYKPVKDILFATDYKFSKKNTFLRWLKDLSKKHDAQLHVLNAYSGEALSEKQQRNQIFLNDFLNKMPHLFHIEEKTDVLEAIAAYKEKSWVDLLVMVHNKHSFFENMLFKPVINQVAYHADLPFLVLPPEQEGH